MTSKNLPQRCRVLALVGVICTVGLVAALGADSVSTSLARPAARALHVRVLQPTLAGASGGQHVIRIDARTERSSVCQAVVRVRRIRTSLALANTDARGRVAWRWLILRSSPSGTWRITVECQHGHRRGAGATSVLVVTESTSAHGSIGDPQSLATPYGTIAGKGGGVCGPFEPGQCTCLAYQKRQDVYDTAVARGVPRGGRRAAGPEFYVWDGEQWLVNAQRAGIPTGSQPIAGALVVWGVPNSAAYGHVAYVEQVASSTRVLISECNYDWRGSCRTIWENPQAAANLQGYIYGGPAGNPSPSGGGPAPTAPTPIPGLADLDFVKTLNTGSSTMEVHWATAASAYQQRGGDFVSDFSPADAGNGVWQLFGSANGAPELGFVKTANAGSGTVEVHWDVLSGSSYKRAGDFTSDFSPADANNGTWQIGPF